MGRKVAIVPAGQWGTALAVPIARGGHDVWLWFRTEAGAEQFARKRRNERRLPGVTLPGNVRGTADLAEAVAGADLVVLASSSAGLEAACDGLAPLLPAEAVVLSLIKAVFPKEPRLPAEFIRRRLGGSPEVGRRIAVLSGPNFAVEVARELPAGTTVAAEDEDVARFVQKMIMSDRFRVWTSTDVVGVQLGGALKNIIAIGAGISDGLGMGDNARAVLVTRGVAEMTRLGVALGANPLTFAGVSGIGDVMLTCTGDLSRNRAAGLAIGRGASPDRFLRRAEERSEPDFGVETTTTVEGIATTKAVHQLAGEVGIEMPITEMIYHILYEGLAPEEGMHRLMTRRAKAELADL